VSAELRKLVDAGIRLGYAAPDYAEALRLAAALGVTLESAEDDALDRWEAARA